MRNQMVQAELDADCAARIEQILAEGLVIRLPWLTNTIVDEWDNPNVSPFHNLCAHGHVSQTLLRVVRRYKVHPGDPVADQLVLPGYTRLQKAYVVERNETGFKDEAISCLVPVLQLTRAEMKKNYRRYHGMADGCRFHAAELARFFGERFPGEQITDDEPVTDEDGQG
jgi:hypothetical protein